MNALQKLGESNGPTKWSSCAGLVKHWWKKGSKAPRSWHVRVDVQCDVRPFWEGAHACVCVCACVCVWGEAVGSRSSVQIDGNRKSTSKSPKSCTLYGCNLSKVFCRLRCPYLYLFSDWWEEHVIMKFTIFFFHKKELRDGSGHE